MTRNFIHSCAVALIIGIGSGPVANATVVQFSDRATFDSAIFFDSQINFDSLVDGDQPNPLMLGDASFIPIDGPALKKYTDAFGLPGEFLANPNSGGIRIELPAGLSAIGFDVANLLGLGGNFRFTLSDGVTVIADVARVETNSFSFIGFTNDMGDIRSLEIFNRSGGNGTFEAVDNVTLGTLTAVPIPAAVWLFGSGLIGLIGVARRKKS